MTGISCSDRSRGKKNANNAQENEEDGHAEYYDQRSSCGHIEDNNEPETVEDDEESVYEDELTIQRQPISAGEHEHRRHLRLYNISHPLNSYNSSTSESYNTETSGLSLSRPESVETLDLDTTKMTPLKTTYGGKSLQAFTTVVPVSLYLHFMIRGV